MFGVVLLDVHVAQFLGQWESAIKSETGNISSVLDDLQAAIDMDGDISEVSFLKTDIEL